MAPLPDQFTELSPDAKEEAILSSSTYEGWALLLVMKYEQEHNTHVSDITDMAERALQAAEQASTIYRERYDWKNISEGSPIDPEVMAREAEDVRQNSKYAQDLKEEQGISDTISEAIKFQELRARIIHSWEKTNGGRPVPTEINAILEQLPVHPDNGTDTLYQLGMVLFIDGLLSQTTTEAIGTTKATEQGDKAQPLGEKLSSSSQRFNWGEFLGKDSDKILRVELSNRVRTIVQSRPGEFGHLINANGEIDYKESIAHICFLTPDTLTEIFSPTDSRTLKSTQQVLSIVYRTISERYLPAETFTGLANDLRAGAYAKSTQSLMEIVEAYAKLHPDVFQDKEASPVAIKDRFVETKAEIVEQHKFPETKDEILAVMTLLMEEMYTKIDALQYAISWPITDAQLCRITGINAQKIDGWINQGYFAPTGQFRHNEVRYTDTDVLKVLFLNEYRNFPTVSDLKKTLAQFSSLHDTAQENFKKG